MKHNTIARKILMGCLLLLLLMPTVSGCAKDSKEVSKSSSDKDEDDSKDRDTEKKKKKKKDKDKDKEKKQVDTKVDLGSDEVIRAYLEGEWTLIDQTTGKDAATLTVKKDGSFTFERLRDGSKGSGTLSFDHFTANEDKAPDMYSIEFDGIEGLLPDDYELGEYEAINSSGIYHIGSGADRDYFYMKEIGNGDTLVSDYAFNVNEDIKDYELWTNNWLFVRDNAGREENDPRTDESFYAWIWQKDGSVAYLQEMDPNEYKAYGEYNDRAYIAGYFSEQDDIAVDSYELADNLDLSDLSYTAMFEDGHPLGMYYVTVDGSGTVTALDDVSIEMYGIYNMGYAEPDISTDGMTFNYNNLSFDMTELVPAANVIMDYYVVGDWVILDLHVNPHFGVYEFFNMYYGDFVYEIQGANLTWKDDDLSTAVYTFYNEVYDFWGHQIGHIDEAELMGVTYKDDDTLEADCWKINDDGEEETFTEEFEYENTNKELMSFIEFYMGNDDALDRLCKEAPENAVAYVMVNPPAIITERAYVYDEEGNGLDVLGILSLKERQDMHIESKDPDESGKNQRYMDGYEYEDMYKGATRFIRITVPEGIPVDSVVLESKEYGTTIWDIATISGKNPQTGTFITAD